MEENRAFVAIYVSGAAENRKRVSLAPFEEYKVEFMFKGPRISTVHHLCKRTTIYHPLRDGTLNLTTFGELGRCVDKNAVVAHESGNVSLDTSNRTTFGECGRVVDKSAAAAHESGNAPFSR